MNRAVLDVETSAAEVFDGFDDAVAVAEFGDLDGDSAGEVVFGWGVAPHVDVADGGYVGNGFDGGLELVLVEFFRGRLHEDGDALVQE